MKQHTTPRSTSTKLTRTTLEELALARRNVVALLVSDGVKNDDALREHAIDALDSIGAVELDVEEHEDNARRAASAVEAAS